MQIIKQFVYWKERKRKTWERGVGRLCHIFVPLSKLSPGHPWQCFRAGGWSWALPGAALCSSPRVSSQFAFYIEEPECLACSQLHLEKLPLKWFPKSSAGNYPSSCWYKAEWAVPAATKAAHAERPASLFESWIGQLLGRGLGFASSVSLLDAAARHQMSYCTILIEKSFSKNWSV